MRNKFNLYPDFGAEIKEIEVNGISTGLINTIINKHASNASYNRSLYERYEVLEEGVPIFSRHPRFQENGEPEPINNKINNDFFSEIIDFETGYFAGNPISYSYSKTEESEDDTGGNEAVEAAAKALSAEIVSARSFEPVDDALIEKAKELIDACEGVICDRTEFGTYEQFNSRLYEYAVSTGKIIKIPFLEEQLTQL